MFSKYPYLTCSVQRFSPTSPISKQSGVATILLVLMISLAMTVGAMGVVYSLRGNQQMQVAAHANTHAQAAAWAGVEVFRKYLYEISDQPQILADLSGDLPMSINNVPANLSAQIVSVSAPAGQSASDTFDITVNIRAQDTIAKSSATVQVVYRIAPFMCGGDTTLSSTLDFHRDLNMGGDITVESDNPTQATFFVDGTVTLDGISASGINALYATDDIYLGSGVYLPEVYSNGAVVLTGSASVGKTYALGEISTTGGARLVSEAYSNSNISVGGNTSGDIYSRANVSVVSWVNTGSIQAGGDVLIEGGPIGNIAARGDVTITGYTSVAEVTSEQDVNCISGWSSYTSINAAGSAASCSGSNAHSGATVSVDIMDELQAFTMEPVRVDAWALKNAANYVFEYESGRIKITVSNINGVTNGSYYLGDRSDGRKDYLCDVVTGAGVCSSPSNPSLKICNGYSDYNDCFNYDVSSQTWQVNGLNMAPGVVWFEGNLELGNGKYYNTFIATGDLETAGSHKTYAVNFAGYDVICNNQFPLNPASHFNGLYPTNLCDTANGVMIPDAVGNIGLLAGGYPPDLTDVYEGGNITLGASTEIFGTVMAGDFLFTGGDTIIHGYISASGLGPAADGSAENSLGGSTTVDLQDLPASFEPTLVPNMSAGGCNSGDAEVSRAYWTKYL